MSAGNTHRPVLKWLVHGHVWLACAVAAQVAYTGLFLQPGSPVFRYGAAAFLGAIAVYGIIRLARSKSHSEQGIGTLGWFRDHRSVMMPLVVVTGISSVALLWPFLSVVWRWLLPAMVVALLYVTPFDSAKGQALGLRTVPFFKVLLIAALWSVVTVAVPWRLDLQEHGTFSILSMACMRMPLFMGLAIIFDIRDMGQDAPGLRTIPVVLGVNGAKGIAIFLLFCSACFEMIFLRGLGYEVASLSILVGYATAMLLAISAKPGNNSLYFDLAVDGMMLLIPFCAWVGMG